jgi:oligopeptide transport system substrate-binding protein
MAERWAVSEDGLVYTFYLRKARWSNKDEVTADDFVYSWERVLNPGTASDYAYQLYYLKNARDYNSGKIKDFNQVGVQALDKLTLQVTLEKPTIYFLELTSFDTLMPVNKRCIEEHGNQWTRPGKIVTNGPFLLKEWKPYQEIVMVKNPDYWDNENVKLDAIVAVSIEDNDTGLKMYLAGETDWIRGIPLAQLEVMKTRPDYYAMPILATYFYRFNITKPPFNDLKVRQAFNLAVDKEALVQYVTKAGQIPAGTFVPPNIPGYNAPGGAGFNPDEAKRLLAGAGFPDGDGFPRVELLYNTSEGHRKIAEVLQEMWKKTLGVEIELVNKEWKVYLKDVSTLNYSISRAGWVGDYADPDTFLNMFVTGGGNNNTGWADPVYDELIKRAAETTDQAKRMEIFKEAESILLKEMPVLPIYFYVNTGLIRPKVKGFFHNPRDVHPFKDIYLIEMD